MRKMAVLASMLAIIAASAAIACRRPAKQLPTSVVLVVLDTTRADRYGSHGYTRDTTPFLDRLAARGARFTHAYSSSSWTVPAHASLFTGLYPSSHGATQEHLYLESGYRTLAELFSDHGYQTVAFSANPLVGPSTNLTQGFDEIHEIWRLERQQRVTRWGESYPHRVNYELRRWWNEGRDPHRPLFLFVNYLDAHAPYHPPDRQALLMLEPGELEAARRLPQKWTDYFLGRIVYDNLSFHLLNALYDAELRYLDGAMEDLVGLLEREGLLENTLLVVTSDHGENIGEHGLVDHVFSLYNTTLYIPLIMVRPGLFPAGMTCDAPVMINDVFPTLVRICGLESGDDPVGTFPLLPGLCGHIGPNRTILSEYGFPRQALGVFRERDRELSILDRYRRSLRSVIRGEYKLIVGSDQTSELYHLAGDPEERHDLIDVEPEIRRELRGELEAFLASLPAAVEPTTATEFNEETRERLRTLGYVEE